jgi:hypothetical protein
MKDSRRDWDGDDGVDSLGYRGSQSIWISFSSALNSGALGEFADYILRRL